MKTCIFHYLTLLANIGLILTVLFIVQETHGQERLLVALFLLPPVLSLIALRKGGDREERDLKKRIRKAELRKQLKDLEKFDKT